MSRIRVQPTHEGPVNDCYIQVEYKFLFTCIAERPEDDSVTYVENQTDFDGRRNVTQTLAYCAARVSLSTWHLESHQCDKTEAILSNDM